MDNKNANIPVITQYAKTYSDPPEKVRPSARGIIMKDNKILLSYEKNTNVYMSPGGGLEEGETLEECCARELKEETGYIVNVKSPFITINEHCFETLYASNYFICEVIGQGESSLTHTEIEHGIEPRWIDVNTALEIFGEYDSKREDIGSLYLREFTVLTKLLKK